MGNQTSIQVECRHCQHPFDMESALPPSFFNDLEYVIVQPTDAVVCPHCAHHYRDSNVIKTVQVYTKTLEIVMLDDTQYPPEELLFLISSWDLVSTTNYLILTVYVKELPQAWKTALNEALKKNEIVHWSLRSYKYTSLDAEPVEDEPLEE